MLLQILGGVVYHYVGQYIASPALGSAGATMVRVCYGLGESFCRRCCHVTLISHLHSFAWSARRYRPEHAYASKIWSAVFHVCFLPNADEGSRSVCEIVQGQPSPCLKFKDTLDGLAVRCRVFLRVLLH